MAFRLDIALLEKSVRRLEEVYTQDQINVAALKAGAAVVHQEMLAEAVMGGRHPKVDTGALVRSIQIGKIKTSGTRKSIDIGVHSGAEAFYAAWVEFGHGGPRPAPAHAYVVPSFDAAEADAYAQMREVLASAKLR